MTSIADTSVKIQATSESNPLTPAWFGEIVMVSSYLQKHGILNKLNEQVRFVRNRFGRYEVIDFLAVLFGYAISGERTLAVFYQRLQLFAVPFMALFERDQLPSRSALSRFLAALTEVPVNALRTLFLDDLLSRPLTPWLPQGISCTSSRTSQIQSHPQSCPDGDQRLLRLPLEDGRGLDQCAGENHYILANSCQTIQGISLSSHEGITCHKKYSQTKRSKAATPQDHHEGSGC